MTLEQLRQKCNALIDSKNHNEVIEVCTQIIQLDPNNAKAFNNRGTAYANLKQSEKAIQDYNKAIELEPNDAEFFYNRGNAYANLKQFEKAIQDYNKAIESNSKYAKAFYNRGVTYRKLGKEKEAILDFKKAEEINPTIITQERIKELEKEFEEKIKQTQASNKEVQGFQEILNILEKNHKTEEDKWFKYSKSAVFVTFVLILMMFIFVICKLLESSDTYVVYVFSSIVTFTIIRQYTNAKALRIEASNRVAMAKMFERVKHENNDYQTEFLPKLVDAIVYSTTKEKNNADGLVEKIINGLTKLKK